jgi:hypothetical protein
VGNGFGLLQRQKVSRTRQVDNPDALAELLAERVAIARRSHFIIRKTPGSDEGLFRSVPAYLPRNVCTM